MINVAIVEDEKEAADRLEKFLLRYGNERGGGSGFIIARYGDAVTFLADYTPKYDIVFMDIELPDLDGMEASKKLREKDKNVMLIFVTNMAQFAVKGYEVKAYDFIVKPVTYPNFSVKLAGALECLRRKRGKDFWITNKDGTLRLNSASLRYVEVVQHMLIYHTEEGDFKATGSMSAAEETLSGEPFALCNRCYLVNLGYVTAVRGTDICLGRERLQISRAKRTSFLGALNHYLAGGN